eukprot:935875-Prorocentrum_minimum.AAC.1
MENASVAPFFVRRWTAHFPEHIPEPEYSEHPSDPFYHIPHAAINWRDSLYLNLALKTSYKLTVAVCSRQAIEASKTGGRCVGATPSYK